MSYRKISWNIFLLVVLFRSFACGRFHTPEFGEPMQNISVVKGGDATFTCHVKNLGRNMVAWMKSDNLNPVVIAYKHKVFRSAYKYKIEVKNNEFLQLRVNFVQPADAGAYMCQVNTNPMIYQTAYLTLQVPPSIIKEKTSGDMVVQEGHNASLFCAAEGFPTPHITWMRQDRRPIQLDGSDTPGVSNVSSPNLTIFKVSRSHMDDYVCMASNGIEPDESWTVKLRVHFQPTVFPVTALVRSGIGADVTLECKAEAWPKPEFFWKLDGRLILALSSKKYEVGVDWPTAGDNSYEVLSRLKIKGLVESDFRKYKCTAENEHGQRSAYVELLMEETQLPLASAEDEDETDEGLGSGGGSDDEDNINSYDGTSYSLYDQDAQEKPVVVFSLSDPNSPYSPLSSTSSSNLADDNRVPLDVGDLRQDSGTKLASVQRDVGEVRADNGWLRRSSVAVRTSSNSCLLFLLLLLRVFFCSSPSVLWIML